MTTNVEKAIAELEAIGATIYPDEQAHFRISGEDNYPVVFADYYKEFGGTDDFGVSHRVNAILGKHGLFCEWINPGALGVYDA